MKTGSDPIFRFVGGKGGVGKTTCAAALAIAAASGGRRTLIVSTDPAPSLGDVFATRVGPSPRAIRLRRGSLTAVELSAERAMKRWLAPRAALLEQIALRGTWLDRDDVARLLGQTLPGIDEIAALLEIARLAGTRRYDAIVVDTAPTGHTLRMLGLPQVLQGVARVFDHMQAKHRAMADAIGGGWRGDAADALIAELETDGADIAGLLRDPARVRMTWVTLPEPMAVEEARDAVGALRREGIAVQDLIVNRLTPAPPQPCGWCASRRAFERRTVARMRRTLHGVRVYGVEERDREPRGLRALALMTPAFRDPLPPLGPVRGTRGARPAAFPQGSAPVALGDAGLSLLLFGGKGGVGKTTCAAAASLDIAARSPDRSILLLSTDPAHSLADVLLQPLSDDPRVLRGGPRNLRVRELDAAKRFAAMRDRYAEAIEGMFDRFSRSTGFDAAHDRQVMRDLIELAPPGVDELVAVLDVTDAIDSPKDGRETLVIMDTAPSGHALRLLEMPGIVQDWAKALMAILLKYQPVIGVGDVGRLLLSLSQGLGRLRALLADPSRTRFIAVTRAEALPRAETARLLARLGRLGISAPIVVVNAVGAGTCGNCVRLRASQRRVMQALAADAGRHRAALAVAPARMPPPSGRASLRRWRQTWRMAAQGRRTI